jgi:hypothetical protein
MNNPVFRLPSDIVNPFKGIEQSPNEYYTRQQKNGNEDFKHPVNKVDVSLYFRKIERYQIKDPPQGDQ